MESPLRILAFAASLRTGSYNLRLLQLAVEIARREGAEVEVAEYRAFDSPMYDADLDRAKGLPPGAAELKRRLDSAQALLLAVPEYNYSIPGGLKNLIDWVSRARPMPWRGKSVYLLSAAPSPMGGIRGLWQTRIPLEGRGALVFPDMFALAFADKAFGEGGSLLDAALAQRLRREVTGFVRMAEAVAPVIDGVATPHPQRRAEIVEALEDESKLQPA